MQIVKTNLLDLKLALDLKAAHHSLYSKTATPLKVAHYDCSLLDKQNVLIKLKLLPVKPNQKMLKFQKKDKFSTLSLEANRKLRCVEKVTKALGGIAAYSTLVRLMQNAVQSPQIYI